MYNLKGETSRYPPQGGPSDELYTDVVVFNLVVFNLHQPTCITIGAFRVVPLSLLN